MAVGDSWVINDPIVGQGANIGSYCAKVMARADRQGDSAGPEFCVGCEAEMWESGEP